MTATTPHLTSGRLLARNTVWNLLGQLLPMAVGLIAVPLLVHRMGLARFGVLSLAWVVIGYFSLFDLGIGRALTKLVADRLGSGDETNIPPLAWTSLLLMLLLGVLGGLLVGATTRWLVHKVLKIPLQLQAETIYSFYLLAISIPLVTVTSGLRGILEAQQRFRILNVIRIPMSIFSFAGPLLTLPFSPSLVPVVGILLAGRLGGLVAHLWACFRTMPSMAHHFELRRSFLLPVFKFGGWMTVSNVVSPLMSYLDRFIIGSLLSVSALAYYTAPFDVVTRIGVIPQAIAGVLFPAFTLSLIQDPKRAELLLYRGLKYILFAVFPVLLCLTLLAPEALRVWLGSAFAEHGTVALRWLAAGVFVNCFAHVPFALIQSGGRPDITAKLHLIELPFYILAVWYFTTHLGIEGTAIAWAVRVTVDAICLFVLAHKILPQQVIFYPRLAGAIGLGLLLFYGATLLHSMTGKVVFLAATLALCAGGGWLWALDSVERTFLFRGKIEALSTQ